MRAISEELKLIYLNTFDSQLSVDFVLARWQYKTIGSYPSSSSILMSREKGKFGDFVNWEQLHQSTWGIGSNSTYHQPKDKCLQRAAPAGWSNSTAMLQDRALGFRGSNLTSGRAVHIDGHCGHVLVDSESVILGKCGNYRFSLDNAETKRSFACDVAIKAS